MNVPRSFQSTCVLETGLSNFHLMTLTVMRKRSKKFQPRVIHYRSYKHFSNEYFRICLLEKLSKDVLVNNDDGFQRFCDINIITLNEHALSKKKYARGNQMPFLTKDLSKAIMKRSRLCNEFLNNKREENRILYVNQRHYCFTFKKD